MNTVETVVAKVERRALLERALIAASAHMQRWADEEMELFAKTLGDSDPSLRADAHRVGVWCCLRRHLEMAWECAKFFHDEGDRESVTRMIACMLGEIQEDATSTLVDSLTGSAFSLGGPCILEGCTRKDRHHHSSASA